MSRIGRLPIQIPAGVKVSVGEGVVNVEGPLGKADEHLDHLSFIARLIGSQTQRERILHATDPDELFDMIATN